MYFPGNGQVLLDNRLEQDVVMLQLSLRLDLELLVYTCTYTGVSFLLYILRSCIRPVYLSLISAEAPMYIGPESSTLDSGILAN